MLRQEDVRLESFTTQAHEPATAGKEVFKSSGADWTGVYNALKNAIKVRHYSPSTLKIYMEWTGKFQAYIRSKDSQACDFAQVSPQFRQPFITRKL